MAPRDYLARGSGVEQDAHPSATTEDLLAEARYLYMLDRPMDDQPVSMQTQHGPPLSVPHPHAVNHVPMVVLHDGTASAFADNAIDSIEEMLLQSKDQPLLYGMAIHTFIVGRPFRLRQFRRVPEHINRLDDQVWFTTAGRAAQHYAVQFPPPAAQAGNTPR